MHSKSFMMSSMMETNMKEKISLWVTEIGDGGVKDVRTDTRYITIDVISRHLWGEIVEFKTVGNELDQRRINDIMFPNNIYLPSWLIYPFPQAQSGWPLLRIMLVGTQCRRYAITQCPLF